MTTVTFRSEGGRLTGFTVSGHSGYDQEGADIVCAAITSALRLTECAFNDVLGLGAAVKVKEQEASISLKLPGSLGEANEGTCQTILAALMVYLQELGEEHPQNLIVYEKDDLERVFRKED